MVKNINTALRQVQVMYAPPSTRIVHLIQKMNYPRGTKHLLIYMNKRSFSTKRLWADRWVTQNKEPPKRWRINPNHGLSDKEF